ncbi:HupE/UreJ family protein [Solimonas terrae]|uniref:HupE/UreJ family protein n=1 Tax=Solimonas terrae TaxID=1396819 RepID=A0A6M2BWQ7_9GAMM|nr:HupE/UreJ family protein [Solimonas terrae]NGY06573.1 HupE/UreJ family protein [Solimonas terrae]
MRGARRFAVALGLFAGAVSAHSSSSSYLQLQSRGDELQGRWDIALRDLDAAIGLDSDGNDALTWGEVRQSQARIDDYALAHLVLRSDGARCSLQVTQLRIAEHADGHYAALDLAGRCPQSVTTLAIDYSLLFDLDRQHRGLLTLQLGKALYTSVLGPETGEADFGGDGAQSMWRVARTYFHEGLWHVWTGLDHMLFLAGLFLPAVLWRTRGGGWQAAPGLRGALWHTAGIVTAFTLAHATTLSLAALGWVHWPSRLIESGVAATVAFAGFNNLVPMVHRRLAAIAAAFGLIHGLAVASALIDLGLPVSGRVWAIATFNFGVEAAQLSLVATVIPVSFVFRHSRIYRHFVLVPGSLLVTTIGVLWFIERAFAVKLLPF